MELTRCWPLLPVMLGLAGFIVLGGCNGDTANKYAQNGSVTLYPEKIDPSLSVAIQNPGQTNQATQHVEILIRTRGEINAAQRAALEAKGARIGSVMGDVLTASVPVQAVPGIANLDFVLRMELSRTERLR